MEPTLPQSLDLSCLPPQAARILVAEYEALQKHYAKPQMSTEEWLKAFNEWVMSHGDVKGVADDSRDSIYD